MENNFITKNKYNGNLPPQQIPFSKKNKEWRMAHLIWADSKTFFNYSPVRKSVIHKKINYDLINGKLHLEDLEVVLNPEGIKEKIVPDNIPHYPIMNTKLDVLCGEELARVFDYRVVVTNATAITEKENQKVQEIKSRLQQLIENQSQDEQSYQQNLQKMSDFFMYEWQDVREVRANQLLNHYSKEYNMPLIFNNGFMDALVCGEEIYQCDIRGGEPVIEKLNPSKVRVFKSGTSNRVEDADIIIIEDYWSPSKVIDTYYDVLTKKDIDYLESSPDNLGSSSINSVGERDERLGFINRHMMDETLDGGNFLFDPFVNDYESSLLPFDMAGNVRVLRMFWKSRRRIKKVKSYDVATGEAVYSFYPETYVIDKDRGEEEWIYYINQAWEGTKIGDEIYVNMRPRVVQYNRMSNPSRCHFGIVGSIYNLNDEKPFSLVDRMKPYNYLYDVLHDRLNKTLAANWGRLVTLDLSLVPKGWDIDKWLYFAKHNKLLIVNSANEQNFGAATGKLAGSFGSNPTAIDAELGGIVNNYINLLQYLKTEMSEIAGISRQREGQIANRETVGGVERATLQSSHITEKWFAIHDDVKKRALECFLETAKIALKGRKEKFSYVLSDGTLQTIDIDGDEFAEPDYGLVVDNSDNTQALNQKIDMLAQAALQNQALNFSSVMKLYSSMSIVEKQRMIEKAEQEMQQRQEQMQQQQQEAEQRQRQAEAELEEKKMTFQQALHEQDNETKIYIAQINAESRVRDDNDGIQERTFTDKERAELQEKIRQFNENLQLEKEKLELQKNVAKADKEYKSKQLQIKQQSKTKK